MILWWANLVGSTIGFTLGSVLLKRFADTNAVPFLLLSLAVLAVSNLFFVQVLRNGLGQGIIASSMAQIILMAALGVLLFGERMTFSQMLGVALAAASIYLIIDSGHAAAVR